MVLETAPTPCDPVVPEQGHHAGVLSAVRHEACVVGQEEVLRRRAVRECERGFLLEVAFHARGQLRDEAAKRGHTLGASCSCAAFAFATAREDQVQSGAVRRHQLDAGHGVPRQRMDADPVRRHRARCLRAICLDLGDEAVGSSPQCACQLRQNDGQLPGDELRVLPRKEGQEAGSRVA